MRTSALIAVICCFLLIPRTQAEEVLLLSGFEAPGLTPPAVAKLRQAYAELGIAIDVDFATPSRALVSSVSGRTDGEVLRIGLVGDRHPSLIRVDVPLTLVATYGYTNRPELVNASQAELKSLRAGHVRGAVFGEKAAEGFREVWSAEEPEQLFVMLRERRLDIVFVRARRAREMIEKFGLADVRAVPSSRRTFPFYHYLHQRHRDLVPKIEEILRRQLSSDDGTAEDNGS